METTKSVGLWIRVSTEFQVKGESPEHHERRARLYVEAKGWHVAEVYRLDAMSGKAVMEYPETKRMLKDVQSGKINALVFSKLARLARNTKELLEFSEIFRKYDADLVSLAENIDTSTSAGRLFFTIIAAMATWEREEISDRVSASVPIRAKMGKPLGGQAPFGYRWMGKKLVIDQNESPIRKLIYDLFIEHRRKGTVARTLNERGYRTRSGHKWTDTTIGRLLHDPMAKGVRRANYLKGMGEGKQAVMKPESEWVLIECPAIVEESLWNECDRILTEQERLNKRPAKKAVHLFTGIVKCDCGSKMYIPSDSRKYVCHKCGKNKIDANDLEAIYYEHLKSFLLTGQDLNAFISKANVTIVEKEQQVSRLEAEIRKKEEEMDRMVKLYTAGEIPKEGFGKHYNPLNEQKEQLEASLPEVQSEIDFLKVELLNGDKLLNDANNLYDRWPTLDHEAKRTIIEQITESLVIANDEICIKYCYTPVLQNAPDSQHIMEDIF
ncbi:MAG: recombinase family protein [Bacteroidota bacterium]